MLVLALLIGLPAACGGDEERVRGIVVDVQGDLSGVASFTIVTREGERVAFVPAPDLTRFDHGAPLTHLAEHLQTGDPVQVTYVEEDGVVQAVMVEDAG